MTHSKKTNHEMLESQSSERQRHNLLIGIFPKVRQLVEIKSSWGGSIFYVKNMGKHSMRIEYSEEYPGNYKNPNLAHSFVILKTLPDKRGVLQEVEVLDNVVRPNYKSG